MAVDEGRPEAETWPRSWLGEFFALIESKGLNYVGLRFDESLFEPDSEIDLLVHPRSFPEVLKSLREVCIDHPQLHVVSWRELPGHAGSIVLAWEEVGAGWRHIFFDLRSGIRKKGRLLFDASMLSERLTTYDAALGVQRLKDHYERALLIIRNTVDERPYSDRHRRILSERSKGDLSAALEEFGWEAVSEGTTPRVARRSDRRNFSHVVLSARYAVRALIGRLLRRTLPLEIVLYGPDGVGKSTQAGLVGEMLRDAGVRRVHVFHSLVEVERYAAVGPPSRSSLRSVAYRRARSRLVMRLIVTLSYLKRLVLARHRTRPLLRNGDAVVHDRYLFDVMSNFQKNRGVRFPKLEAVLCRLVPSEPLVVLLDASPEIVSARTGELSPSQVSETYRLLESCLKHAGARVRGWARVDANVSQTEVARAIVRHVLHQQTNRALGEVAKWKA